MSDLLALLGAEWAPQAPPCSVDDRLSALHGCPSCMRAPTHWDEVTGAYLDGMGRPTHCGYCYSCVGSGRTSIRDPWTDELLDYAGAPCPYCAGTGWLSHGWDCDPAWHQRAMVVHEWEPPSCWGVIWNGSTVAPWDTRPER